MCKVSVIVPIYNTEEFLPRCLNSLISQTLKDIEIICINDGSTDNSLSVLKDFAQKDSRIRIINQENAKQGTARNKGIKSATGEFITFVDSDDWVDKNYLEKLYNVAVKNSVNLAVASTTRDYPHRVKPHIIFDKEEIVTGANNIVKALKNHLEPHGKLYRFENIKNLFYPQEVFYEDAPYVLQAIINEKSMITMPDAHYHYFSNEHSTIKQNSGIKNENDKIEMNLLLLKIAKVNNIDLGDFPVLKERHFLRTVKHYLDHKDYYLFGIKIRTKRIRFNSEKTFVVFNTSYFGDVLLCDSLIQNIKHAFPDSRIIFVVNKGFQDVAKYSDGVDEVVVFDTKDRHKGFLGLLRFIKDFKYKDVFASIITYNNARNYLAAKLIKSRFIKMGTLDKSVIQCQIKHNRLLRDLTNRNIKNFPIKYNVPQEVENPVKEPKYIALCTTSKKLEKDMPLNTAVELINKINQNTDYKVVLVGNGDAASNYAKNLKSKGCDFIDLINQTTIVQLAKILKDSKCLISIDTGTMHLGYAVGAPVVCVFYIKEMIPFWAPDENLYKVKVLSAPDTDEIFKEATTLCGK